MRKIKAFAIILTLLTLSACTKSAEKGPVEVLGAYEWVITHEDGKPNFDQSNKDYNEVPYKTGNGLGWILDIRSNIDSIELMDVIHLPAPGVWPEKTDLIISDDKKNAVAKRTMVNKGYIYGSWKIAEGDPKGDYSVDVYVNHKYIKSFHYHVK